MINRRDGQVKTKLVFQQLFKKRRVVHVSEFRNFLFVHQGYGVIF